jgi:hypothetical protein
MVMHVCGKRSSIWCAHSMPQSQSETYLDASITEMNSNLTAQYSFLIAYTTI